MKMLREMVLLLSLIVCLMLSAFVFSKVWEYYHTEDEDEIVLGMTCDNGTYEKIFETCRRGLVDKMQETYLSNRPVIVEHCNLMAQRITCEYVNESRGTE